MAEKLESYRAKRDFGKTSEPSGGRDGQPAQGRFVVQEHHARRLHWDLRLEHDGVLASWALPRGIPAHPAENRLAVHTEDHPLEYLDFEGDIPKGEYGAGTMRVWDRGTYEAEKFRDDEVIATFHGERLKGRYALFQTRGQDWLMHRMDPPDDPEYEPMPDRIKPMLARPGELPRDERNWGFEVKWDGIRTVVFCDHGHIALQGRNFTDFTARYPEVRPLARELGARRVILDGEIVALDEQGRPSFERLQSRMHLASDSAVKRRMRDTPVTYVAFDVLYIDGRSTMARPYEERRELLEELELEGPAWRAPAYHRGEGSALLGATRELGIEGIVAKRLDSTYEPGRRSSAWLKIKNVCEQDVVIGGWTPGEGGRSGRLGSLVCGVYDDDRLVYVGKVGSGFTEQTLALLQRELEPLRRPDSPFTGRQPPKGSIFVEPRLVARVELREWTRSGTMRAPSFKGLRDDVDPQDCVREEGPCGPGG
ncbi:MAG: bifunctional non-ous end joining protein LigD [Thermoleophilaceae bacterium]|jgi:bifunctional non-homologous end joining protein LigD|nr:bifunctional non-ous end joining protein LigD [Thermoleophilaceae bacterium]